MFKNRFSISQRMKLSGKYKLAIVLTHPVQYFKPIFAGLSDDRDITLLVFYGCDHGSQASYDPDFGVAFAWDSCPTAGFPHQFMSTASLEILSSPLHAFPIALKTSVAIREYNPDAVLIFSYSPAYIRYTTLLLSSQGHKIWLRAETSDRASLRSAFKNTIRSISLRLWYRMYDYFFQLGVIQNSIL